MKGTDCPGVDDECRTRTCIGGICGDTFAAAGTPLPRAHPNLRGASGLKFVPRNELPDADVVFTCPPHTQAMAVVPGLMRDDRLVIDLSADFRLRALPTYERWYGAHGAPELLEGAFYGLSELSRDERREAELVATPGCYPTAGVLALAPLAERGLLADVVIDAKQGVSGAGRGGGDVGSHGAAVVSSEFAAGRVSRVHARGAGPRPVTPAPAAPNALRYADGCVAPDGAIVVSGVTTDQAAAVVAAFEVDGIRRLIEREDEEV